MEGVTGKMAVGGMAVEGEPLQEGRTVTVLAPESDDVSLLDSELEEALLAAMAEADRGETVTGEELMTKLRD